MSAKIRKIVTIVEETQNEGGRPVEPPTRRAAVLAVIDNPFAGRYVDDLLFARGVLRQLCRQA